MSKQDRLPRLGKLIALVMFVITIPLFLTSCDLDKEGGIKLRTWLITDGGRGNWQEVALDGSSPLNVIVGDCCHTKRSNACAKQETSLQHAGYFDHVVTNFPHGSTDVFIVSNGKWHFRTISNNGRTGWQASDYHLLNSSNVSALDLRLVDFDGDCRTDVFTTWGGKWRVSEDGTGPWKVLRNSNIDVKDLRFGDFNNDGRTDVFSSWGGKWHVSYSGESAWVDLRNSNVKVSDLLIADFEGDGTADVFATWSGKWWISENGTGAWKTINTSNIKVPNLRIGDFNGDGKADVFTSSGGKWQISWQGESSWNPINTSNKPLHSLKFGDFDGDGTTDVFTIIDTQ